jgi:hypothetical protein
VDRFTRLIIFLAALLIAPFSFAQSFGDLMAKGVTYTAQTDAVRLLTTGSVNAAAINGTRAVVPVTATAIVGKAAYAATAVKLVRAGSAIGLAYTAYQVYDWIKTSGITTCAPPDFFCKPSVDPATPLYFMTSATGSNQYPTEAAACAGVGPTYSQIYTNSTNRYCWNGGGGYANITIVCPANYSPQYPLSGCKWIGSGTAPQASAGGPYTDPELITAVTGTNWDPTRTQAMRDAILADMKKQPGVVSDADLLPTSTPVTVSGSPVTAPQVTTSVKTSPNSDGSTSTTTVKETTTFTPSQRGTTVADTAVDMKQATVVTTTVTNNTTNITNTTTDNQTPATTANPDSPDMCKLHPDALACQKLGATFDPTPVPDKSVALTINPDTGWGASNGTCPAPKSFVAHGGHVIEFKWDIFCNFATGVRPFFIGLAYLSAIFGFLGLSKK